jgi:PPOX class probable F420-dependent enzyme
MPQPIAIPSDIRPLLEAPNYAHLATLRADGSPRSHVVWVGVEGDLVLVCTPQWTWKARDMVRDPRVSLSVTDINNPYRMAALQGTVIEVRDDSDCRYMNPIATKYTGRPWPMPGPDRRCFAIAIHRAGQVTLGFRHAPALAS